MPTHYKVANWERHQHYKSGRSNGPPPWLKVYRDLLDNEDWFDLTDAQRYHVIGIWLLAARHDGVIPAKARWVAQRIGATEHVDLEALAAAGWLLPCDASGVLADCYQDASNLLAERYQPASSGAEQAGNIDASNVLATCYQPASPEKRREEKKKTHSARVREELTKAGIPDRHLDAAERMMRAGEEGAAAVSPHGMTPDAFRADALARKLGNELAECIAADEAAAMRLMRDFGQDTPPKPRWWRFKSSGWLNVEHGNAAKANQRAAGNFGSGSVELNEWGEPLRDAHGALIEEW